MMTLLQFPFAISFLLTVLSLLGIYFGHSYLAILLVLVLHPLLDTWIGPKRPQNPAVSPQFFDRFLILTVAMVYMTWFFCLYHFVTAATLSESLFIATACGLVMGFLGITTAHELVHRPGGLLKWLGFATLWILNYGHWGIEHVYGHHKNVATPNDPVSARKNENIFFYLLRAIGGSFFHSFEFEKNKSFFKSKVKLSLFIQLLINLSLFAAFGIAGLVFHWVQSLIAIVLLEGVEYVEHYGLVRKKMDNGLFEPVNERHSWDCDFFLTNAALINLGYHSHHHQKPLVPFQDLPNKLGSRQLPLGYSMMILIAFFPPLYFHIMNPKLEHQKSVEHVTA
jgi:alkane 1-monooxygenase